MELRAFDRRRKKKTSNREWTQPVGPEARIVRTKCGRTRRSHDVAHAVDLESGAVAAVEVQPVRWTRGDTTLAPTLREATANLEDAGSEYGSARAVVCDKGCHPNATMVRLQRAGMRSYVAGPAAGGVREPSADAGGEWEAVS